MKSYDPCTTEYTGEVFDSLPECVNYVHDYLGKYALDFDAAGIADEMFDYDFDRNKYYAKSFTDAELTNLLWKYVYADEVRYTQCQE